LIVEESKPGIGNARKTGMDCVVRRFANNKNFDKKHFVLITDADTKPPSNWIEKVVKGFKEIDTGALSGTHGASVEIDERIEKMTGINNYFNIIPNLIEFLQEHSACVLKMNGQNSAFEVVAYCMGGGMDQPEDIINSKIIIEGTSLLANNVKRLGLPIKLMYVRVNSNKRRQLMEILKKTDMYIGKSAKENRIISIRDDEQAILNEALANVSKKYWVDYRNKTIDSVLKSIVFKPLLENTLNIKKLNQMLGDNLYKELKGDLKKLRLENKKIDAKFKKKWRGNLLNVVRSQARLTNSSDMVAS